MPCNTIKIGNATAIVCSRGRKTAPCFYCGLAYTVLCDFPVKKQKNGKWKTCDRKMCADCTQKGASENTDFCKAHYKVAKEAFERRQARQGELYEEIKGDS